MSRYEQQIKKGGVWKPVLVSVILILIVAVWWYLFRQQENGVEVKTIELPKENVVSVLDMGMPLDQSEMIDIESFNGDVDVRTNQKELSEPIVMPKLEDSDVLFKQEMSLVSINLLKWFEADGVIEKYMVIINDLSQKELTYKHSVFIQRPNKMKVGKDSQGLYLTKSSYKRYDNLANAVEAIDVQQAISFYSMFKPLFEQVYKGFSYPDDYKLGDIFLKAAASVIAAPIIEDRIALTQHSIRYKFTNEKLEMLDDVKKQMIRMGPKNTQKIQAKFRQLVQAFSALSD